MKVLYENLMYRLNQFSYSNGLIIDDVVFSLKSLF